jgi:hypothetical protein
MRLRGLRTDVADCWSKRFPGRYPDAQQGPVEYLTKQRLFGVLLIVRDSRIPIVISRRRLVIFVLRPILSGLRGFVLGLFAHLCLPWSGVSRSVIIGSIVRGNIRQSDVPLADAITVAALFQVNVNVLFVVAV